MVMENERMGVKQQGDRGSARAAGKKAGDDGRGAHLRTSRLQGQATS